MLEMLRTELHCHNVFSNGHVGDLEPPFDCNVTINQQLQKSLDSKLDVLFVTNHNTLDGFKQMTDYKNSHEKFSNVKVYPAVEITTDKEAHVLLMVYKKKSNHLKVLMKFLMLQNHRMQ